MRAKEFWKFKAALRLPEYYRSRLRKSPCPWDNSASEGAFMTEMNDVELKLSIDDLLSSDPHIDSSGIQVKAELGFISLNGFVQDQGQRELVERVVREADGVKDVFNYLSLKPRGLVGDDNLNHNVI
jgi:osmotically-inducible protein OsmY